jgi:heme oxygenase
MQRSILKVWVLMNEFDKLNALFYEWQALEREVQRHRNDEIWKTRAFTFIQKLLEVSVGKKKALMAYTRGLWNI